MYTFCEEDQGDPTSPLTPALPSSYFLFFPRRNTVPRMMMGRGGEEEVGNDSGQQ